MQKLTPEQRFEAKRKELLKLKDELRKAKAPYTQAILNDEIRAVARVRDSM